MTLNEYTQTIEKLFAANGFIGCPLTELEIKLCHTHGVSIDQAYNIGCDLYCEACDDFLSAWIENVG